MLNKLHATSRSREGGGRECLGRDYARSPGSCGGVAAFSVFLTSYSAHTALLPCDAPCRSCTATLCPWVGSRLATTVAIGLTGVSGGNGRACGVAPTYVTSHAPMLPLTFDPLHLIVCFVLNQMVEVILDVELLSCCCTGTMASFSILSIIQHRRPMHLYAHGLDSASLPRDAPLILDACLTRPPSPPELPPSIDQY